MIPFIAYKNVWLSISTIAVVLSLIGFFTVGLNYGIDFTGGTLMELQFTSTRPAVAQIGAILGEFKVQPVIQPVGERGVIIRSAELSGETHAAIFTKMKEQFGEVSEIRFESIGPALGRELRSKTIIAIILACLAIILYLAFTFRRVSRPVASWQYGILAVVALLEDIIILTGIFVLLGKLFNTEVDTSFVAALLTTLGYAVNDAIVTFDRIRERLPHSPNPFAVTVNRSLNETLTRSLFTGSTAIITVLPVYLWGGETIKTFLLALMLGIAVGTFTTLLVASSLLVVWQRGHRR
jgi:preprotein translocase subunit SecF